MFRIWQIIEVNKPLYALNLGVYSIQVHSNRRYVANYRRETLQTSHDVRLINLYDKFTQTFNVPKTKKHDLLFKRF